MYFFSNILEGEVRNGGPCIETVCDQLLREGSCGDSVVDMHLVGRPFQGRRSVVSLGGGRDTHISAGTLAPPLGRPGFRWGEGGGSSGRF